MLLGVIADDFTGASDIGNTLAKGLPGEGGLRVAQYFDIPTRPAGPEIEAGVISLKVRSSPAAAAVDQALAALAWLQDQGCRQFVFKYCSTFDSTPEGNIGPVGEALAERLGVVGVLACPAFPAAGRTVFNGHLFVNGRLLSESGMQHHPATPMTDPDLRRWLRLQTRAPVGLVPLQTVMAGPGAVRLALADAASAGERLVVADAVTDEDLLVLGEAAADAPLLTGGSGIAIGLPRNFLRQGAARGGVTAATTLSGAEAILAGSCSAATGEQIEMHARAHPVLPLDVDKIMAGEMVPADAVSFVLQNTSCRPLVYSWAPVEIVAAQQQRHGRAAVAERLDGFFADLARALIANGLRRLVVAGGETSGAIVRALDIDAVRIGPEIDPGVPLLYSLGTEPLALALKSGNFGAPDFFEKALRMMEG